MTAEQLARETMDELERCGVLLHDANAEIAYRIVLDQFQRIFRAAEATIRDRLSRVRVCDD
jgi:hypothetical protein